MGFKIGPVQPDYASLIISLTNSKLQTKDYPLYQTIFLLIDRITKSRDLILQQLESLDTDISALKAASYLTENDETIFLPNSRQVLAGLGIEFDDSIAGVRVILQSGYWTPLTDGDVDETDLIFANGSAIAVLVPNPPPL